MFCETCASEKILYCSICGTGYNPGRVKRLDSKCGCAKNSKCPQCGKPLIVIYYTRGGKFYRYMLECLSCGWHSAMSRDEGGAKYGVREKTELKTIESGISKGYISLGPGTGTLCKGDIITKGCPQCHHDSLPIADIFPTMDFETLEAEKVGNEVPLRFYIRNKREPCTVTFMIKNLARNSTIEMYANERTEYVASYPIPLDFPLGILHFEAQLELKLGRYPKPVLCELVLGASCFILPKIDVDMTSEEMQAGAPNTLPIQITNNSEYVIDDIRVVFEMGADFKVDDPVKSISQIGPGETRGIVYYITPLVMGVFDISGNNTARISFKMHELFDTITFVIRSNSLQITVTEPPEGLILPVGPPPVSHPSPPPPVIEVTRGEYDPEYVYCPFCGTKMPMLEGLRFCIECGKDITEHIFP
ncbi:MAG: hypothetical protein ACFFCD_05375 [Promethearchaeota archaeon]